MPDRTMNIPTPSLSLGQRVQVVGEYAGDWRHVPQIVVGINYGVTRKTLEYTTVEIDGEGNAVGGLTDGWKPEHLEPTP